MVVGVQPLLVGVEVGLLPLIKNSTSSKLSHWLAEATDEKPTVHWPLVTLTDIVICVHVLVVGMFIVCVEPPQFSAFITAVLCPPPDMTQERSVYVPLVSPVFVW